MPDIFIAGCGYCGERLARTYRDTGTGVTCMVRSPERAQRLTSDGFVTTTLALDDITELPPLDLSGQTVFYLVPPPGGGTSDLRARNFISLLSPAGTPKKIIYMSATSVYHETDGGTVTEASPTIPDTAMGKRRLDAEIIFRDYGSKVGIPVITLRVSGIYGPGRLPLMQISQGQPLLNEEESGPSNRIHVDDLADICRAAALHGNGGDIFNVSDGHPSSMTSYFDACADALSMPRQPRVSLTEARQLMTPLMFSYVSQSRIVDNSAMMHKLRITLRYPTAQEGLKKSMS